MEAADFTAAGHAVVAKDRIGSRKGEGGNWWLMGALDRLKVVAAFSIRCLSGIVSRLLSTRRTECFGWGTDSISMKVSGRHADCPLENQVNTRARPARATLTLRKETADPRPAARDGVVDCSVHFSRSTQLGLGRSWRADAIRIFFWIILRMLCGIYHHPHNAAHPSCVNLGLAHDLAHSAPRSPKSG
jgi:hypothetical protein